MVIAESLVKIVVGFLFEQQFSPMTQQFLSVKNEHMTRYGCNEKV